MFNLARLFKWRSSPAQVSIPSLRTWRTLIPRGNSLTIYSEWLSTRESQWGVGITWVTQRAPMSGGASAAMNIFSQSTRRKCSTNRPTCFFILRESAALLPARFHSIIMRVTSLHALQWTILKSRNQSRLSLSWNSLWVRNKKRGYPKHKLTRVLWLRKGRMLFCQRELSNYKKQKSRFQKKSKFQLNKLKANQLKWILMPLQL